MDPGVDRIERLLNPGNARRVLLGLALVSVVAAIGLRNVRLEYDFEKFFPTDDPEIGFYLEYRDRFGHDNDHLMIGVAHAPGVLDRRLLLAVDSLAARLAQLPDVEEVLSLTRLDEVRITPLGVFRVPWLRLEHDSLLAADSARVLRDPFLRGRFIAADGRALAIVVQCAPGLSKERSDALMGAVQQAVDRSGLRDVRIGGRIHGQYWYIAKMRRELVLFFSVAVAMLALFLAIGFRTLWGVLVPIGTVALTVLWQVALMTVLGRPLTVLTMLLPTILFVVGMSDVVHILERYIEALRTGHQKHRALAIALREVGLATFLTSLTTAIGFGTLVSSGIQPIREFGLFTAIGVILAFGLAFTLLPAVLVLVPTPVVARTGRHGDPWYPWLHGLLRRVVRARARIPWIWAAAVVLSMAGIARLEVDNYLLEDWPDDDPQKAHYFWFEEHFGGVRPFELEVRSLDSTGTIWDVARLRDQERVQEHLERDYGVQAVLSPVTLLKAMNKASNGGDPGAYALPEDDAELRSLVGRTKAVLGRAGLERLVSADERTGRITGRIVDRGGHRHAALNAALEAFVAQHTDGKATSFRQTGMAYLIDRSNARLSGQLIKGLSAAFLLIAGIMALVFRQARMVVVALLPNVVPLLLVGGIMGVAGIDIKVSTAIIFTIAFGIAVDDTIHLLGKLRVELNKGRTVPMALRRAHLSAGRALIVTSLMLLSGFLPLVFSSFAGVFYMGLLVSLTLALALLADLTLLPVLVLRYLRPRSRARWPS